MDKWKAIRSIPEEGWDVWWIRKDRDHDWNSDVCTVRGNDEASAHLIAAAPDLYEAAKALDDHLLFNVFPSAGIRNMFAAAIAKAEGKSIEVSSPDVKTGDA